MQTDFRASLDGSAVITFRVRRSNTAMETEVSFPVDRDDRYAGKFLKGLDTSLFWLGIEQS